MHIALDIVAVAVKERKVHVARGSRVLIDAGGGVRLELERFGSGAVTLRDLASGHLLRSWAPKDARRR